MSHNYGQIIDGIQDQIAELEALQVNYESQVAALQTELSLIPNRILELQGMLTQVQGLSANSVDINLNLNIAGASHRTSSTAVGY